MNLAPLPDHDRTDDPLWHKLFHAYRHLLTPLRRNGWVTDVELCGGEWHLRADLGDGSELLIASSHSLPADPGEVQGWSVTRQSVEDPSGHTVLYDSTPAGPQHHHGTSLVPLFLRLERLEVCTATSRLHTSASTLNAHGAVHHQTGPVEAPGTAAARYVDWAERLSADGWHKVWERPDEDQPLAVFECISRITIVRLTPIDG